MIKQYADFIKRGGLAAVFALGLALSSFSAVATAADAAAPATFCPLITGPVEIVVMRDEPVVTEHWRQSQAQIMAHADKSSQAHGFDGLTTDALVRHVTGAFTRIAPVSGGWCATPSKIFVRLGYTQTSIYFSDALTPGSCYADVVRAHEYTHVMFDEMGLDQGMPAFRAAGLAKLRQLRVKPAATAALAQHDMLTAWQTATKPDMLALSQVSKQLHQQIDSKQEYARLDAICG